MINSKGFRDENGEFITIPGASVKYNPELAGHLAQFGENGEIEDGGKAIDQTPTIGSTNLVTSGGVYSAINNRMAIARDSLDSVVGIQEVHNTAQDEEFDEAYIIGDDRIMLGLGEQASNKKIYINMSNAENLERALANPDSTPTDKSDNLITSQAVYNALAGKTSLVIDPLIVLQKGSSLAEYTLISSSETQTNLTAIHNNLGGKEFITKVYVRNNGADMSFQGIGYVDPTNTYGAISIIIGDIYVSIIRASANASWTLEGVYKVSEIF